MMRTHYLQQLSELEELLGKMGGLIVNGLSDAHKALKTRDDGAIKAAASVESRTDSKLEEIERLCSLLLLTQQPVASDMRFIVSVMNIVVDMERIGDQIRDIAEISGKCGDIKLDEIPELKEMSECCEVMIKGALESFVGRDVDKAKKIISKDDIIDAAFEKLQIHLSEGAKVSENVSQLLNILMIGKYYERIGDHATNIAEWTNYVVTGHK